VRWLFADEHLALAIPTVLTVVAVEIVKPSASSVPTDVIAILYLAAQLAIARVPRVRAMPAWRLGRLALATLFVSTVTILDAASSATLPVLYVPIVALGAAIGARPGAVIAVLAVASYVAILGLERGSQIVLTEALVPVTVVVFLAIGTRRVVAALEHSVERAHKARARDRRRARQIGAVEEVGRILAREGPTGDVLGRVMELLDSTFGYHYPSVYLWDGAVLRLGAQRNYANPIEVFDPTRGVIGRITRTREAVFLPDVTMDPDYESADPDVNGEISVPLLSGGDFLGVLNVESNAARRLDAEDFATLQIVGDRLAAALALGHERQNLGERAALLGRLTESSAQLGGTLDPVPLQAAIARAATTVVSCDIGVLTLLEKSTGAFRVAAAHGADVGIGMTIDPGEGATGTALASRTAVLADRLDQSSYPRAAGRAGADLPQVAVMAIPMLRDDVVHGALTFIRRTPGAGFSEQEREIAQLLVAQTALAIANSSLHAETQEATIRDPLTGLHNRRLLDDVLVRMSAARARQQPEERRPVAGILFDLDHFGDLNNRHGHSAGDAVLRAFAGILSSRFRTSDVVARYGGEEFLVVLDGGSRDDALRAAEDVRVAFRGVEIPIPGGERLRAAVSAGCAALDPSVAGLEMMIELADVGLAMAKAGGRDQVVAA